jgi:hypothetical protein
MLLIAELPLDHLGWLTDDPRLKLKSKGPALQVERRPFLAPEAVIFGVIFTGPYILVVKYID